MKQNKNLTIIFVILITISAFLIAKLLPWLGSGLIAILLGAIVSLVYKDLNNKVLKKVIKFFLNIAIILMGFSININLIIKLGINLKTVLIILVSMSLTFLATFWIAKSNKQSKNFSYLFAIGNTICGSSAIISSNQFIKSDDHDQSSSLTIVNLLGLILMILLPNLILLLKYNVLQSSFILGSTIQSIGQVVGGAHLAGEKYVLSTTVIKLIRVFMLTFVLLALSLNNVKKSKLNKQKNQTKLKLFDFIPLFLILFICSFTLTNTIKINHNLLSVFHFIENLFEVIALSAIGMQINFKKIYESRKAFLKIIIITISFQVLNAILLSNLL